MLKVFFQSTLLVGILAALILAPAGCRSKKEEPIFTILTGSGLKGWRTEDRLSLAEGTYMDRGHAMHSVLLAADSGGLKLTSPQVPTGAGRTLSFTFALKSESAVGLLFEARLKVMSQTGKQLTDSLLYSLSSRSQPGLIRDWISYTRALQMPPGAATATVEVSSRVSSGKVWLGETSLLEGESWLAYAASFSPHLGQNPEAKYIYTAGRFIQPDPEPEPTPEENRSGLLFFERKGLVDAWPYATARPTDRVEIMNETVPTSATAPFAFAVKALEDLSSIEVKIGSPLSGEQGILETLPHLYQARFAASRLGGSWGTEFGVRARMLTPIEPMPLSKGEARFFWLDIPVPKGAKPGKYLGGMTIEAEGHSPLEIPFSIEVLPLELPPLGDEHVAGIYYYPPDDPGLIEPQFKDMAAHGVNAISLSGSFVKKDTERGVVIDYERVNEINRLMILMRKHGLFRPTPLYVVDLFRKLDLPRNADQWGEQEVKLYERAIRLMDNTATRWGWCKLLFFPVDEPANNAEDLKLAELTLGILRNIDGIMVLCDLNTRQSVLDFSKYLNAVCIQISSVSPETVGAMKENNVETFMYLPAFGSSDVGHDAAYHRSIPGWFLTASGIKGIYYFAYQSINGNPYDELDGGHRDWCAAYPAAGPEAVWPSPEWQGIRRGIEDLRLICLGRKLIGRCSTAENEEIRLVGQKASARLDSILAVIKPGGEEVIYQLHHELDTYVAEKWRQELIVEVLAMQEALP
jgi:hypothetical protein